MTSVAAVAVVGEGSCRQATRVCGRCDRWPALASALRLRCRCCITSSSRVLSAAAVALWEAHEGASQRQHLTSIYTAPPPRPTTCPPQREGTDWSLLLLAEDRRRCHGQRAPSQPGARLSGSGSSSGTQRDRQATTVALRARAVRPTPCPRS